MNRFDENVDQCGDSQSSAESDEECDYSNQLFSKYRPKNKGKIETMNSMWCITIESLGTALKIFAPAAILSWFYKHDTFVFRLLQQCDKAIRSVLFRKSNPEDDILKWLQDIFPFDERVKSLEAIWKDGSVICDLVESVVPGSNEDKSENDLNHGQRLAEQYLGVTPIFSTDDLKHPGLSKQQEYRLIFYLGSVKDSLNKLSPPISRTGSPILNSNAYTLDYVARGMGLITACKNKKSTFYIYPTAQQGLEPAEISVQIKGPGGCYGSTIVPPIYGKTHIVKNVLLNFRQRQNSIEHSDHVKSDDETPIKVFTMLKLINDIEVRAITKNDRAKITFVPNSSGLHELSVITKGCHVMGSPYRLNVEPESSRSVSYDSEDDGGQSDKTDRTNRKIVFKIVDFVTEKMLLTDDGHLEKISAQDVETLIHTVESMENIALKYVKSSRNSDTLIQLDLMKNINFTDDIRRLSKKNFKAIVSNILLLLRICRELKEIPSIIKPQDSSIPDIINSSLTDDTDSSAKAMRSRYRNRLPSFNQTNDAETDTVKTNEIPINNIPKIDIIISSFDEDNQIDNVLETLPVRPKTPVIKLLECDDDLDIGRCSPTINFRIGEPVTPSMTCNPPFDNDVESIISASNIEEALIKYDQKLQRNLKDGELSDDGSSFFATPLRLTPFEQMTDNEIIQMYEEPVLESTNKSSEQRERLLSIKENEFESLEYDEAIDEEELSKMGPAERELWNSISNHNEQRTTNINPKTVLNYQCTITPIDENEVYISKLNKDLNSNDISHDVKSSEDESSIEKRTISSIQPSAECRDVNCTNKKTISKTISEKKEFWDHKIKSIEVEDINRNLLTTKSMDSKSLSPETKTESKSLDYQYSTDVYDQYSVATWKEYWTDRLQKGSALTIEDFKNIKNVNVEGKIMKENTGVTLNNIYEACNGFSAQDNLLKVEKNKEKIVVKRNDHQSEKRLKNMENLAEPVRNEVDVKIELETLPLITNVKEKIHTFNSERVEKARQSFIANKSKTIDIPRVSSFRTLQKYFSVDNLDHDSARKNLIPVKLSEKCESVDSVLTLAEKKSKLEAHLIMIQKRRSFQSQHDNNPDCVADKLDVKTEVVRSEKSSLLDIQTELDNVIKPINLLVARFESQTAQNEKPEKKYERSHRCTLKVNEPPQDAVTIKDRTADVDSEDINSDLYKERFKQTKMFFQHIDQQNVKNRSKSPNECEKLLADKLNNTVVNNNHRKIACKAHSTPTSDSEVEFHKFLQNKYDSTSLKISEKYLVDNLFKDIIGAPNRFGSLRGIPHKKAVLATFKSMESIQQFPSYEYIKTEYENFNTIKPSKRDRMKKLRRNSAPGAAR